MSTTAGDQINAALRLIGQLAEGETPSAATSQDALAALNQMLDSWNTDRLLVYTTQTQVFSWPAGQATRTIGPTGDFVGNRPVFIDDATYFDDPGTGVSYGIKLINQQQYNGIALKNVTSTYPQVMYVNNSFPDMTMTVYPVPTAVLTFYIVSIEELSTPATLATALAFPPGYLRCFKYNLAMEIANEFGVEPLPQVQRIAMDSRRKLKRVNSPDNVMSLPYSIVATRQRYNIYANNF
jgi:hypothetical protein